MNDQREAQMQDQMNLARYAVVPLLYVILSWGLVKLLFSIAQIGPEWGSALFWAASLALFFVIEDALELPGNPFSMSPAPRTKKLALIKFAAMSFYTLLYGAMFALAGRHFMPPWIALVLPVVLALMFLPIYFFRYRNHARRLGEEATHTGQ